MLYLEDYLEMIENLPMEMKERLTEMREVDLQVQNNLDSLDDRVTTFFKKCLMSTNNKQDWKEEEFEAIKKDYYKTLEDTDEKVQLANHVHDLVDRHLRKLDQELAKFKMELEADNAGITEVLEKRSLELDKPASSSNSHRAEKRRGMASSVVSGGGDKRSSTEVLSTLAHEAVRETIGGARRPNSATSSPAMNMFSSGGGSNIGASSNPAIAAAASQAIVATQQMQQGRRTSSMKASYDLLTKAQPALPKEVSMGYPATPSSSSSDSASRSQRRQKQTSKTAAMQQQQQQQQQQLAQQLQQVQPALAQQLAQPATPVLDLMEDYSGDGAVVDDWSSDPNEPRYCLCNQVSYGDMVGCDNKDCPIEWFHYGCVGLSQAPKGKWYCPQCMAAMRRRGRR